MYGIRHRLSWELHEQVRVDKNLAVQKADKLFLLVFLVILLVAAVAN